jgi:hypothetical protein
MKYLKVKSTSAAICALSLVLAGTAFAAGATRMGGSMSTAHTTRTTTTTTKPTRSTKTATSHGQPNQSCETTPNQPGNSISAPGSAFNPDGTAGTKYAGEQPQNSKNPTSVSQYDVACTRPTH